MNKLCLILIFCLTALLNSAQSLNPFHPDPNPPVEIPGMKLVWSDEFNVDGKPNPENWKYEKGFERNEELQWYQEENANCSNRALVIEGRCEEIPNPGFVAGHSDW